MDIAKEHWFGRGKDSVVYAFLKPVRVILNVRKKQTTLHKAPILGQYRPSPKFNQNNMETKPPEGPIDPAAEVPGQQANQPGTVPAEGRTSLTVYYKLEDITSVGPDLTDVEAACKGMPFASTYFGFWESHRAFFETIRANQLQDDDTKQAMAAAREKAKERFIKGYGSFPAMTPEELDDSKNFFGSIFKTGVTNGLTFFTEWLETPDGQRELTRAAAPMMLRALFGHPEEHLEPRPEA